MQYFDENFSCGLPWMDKKILRSVEEIPDLYNAIHNYTCIASYGCTICDLSESAKEGTVNSFFCSFLNITV